ncbi:MAG: hypothetical protein MUP98_03035 [Candidatus Aminicenantes bacterium]|nr:hypothetical protein [Candidatus Aminicenantes bacterium]
MINFYFIGRIAFYEARLLFRSWGFRIFSGLGLILLTLINIGLASPSIFSPYFISSLSGSLPLNSLKLFNVFQGIIVAFMATEFFKRDRRHDSVQVVFARSFSNVEYFLGKVVGIFSVFLLLNIVVLLITFVIHFFFSNTLFALQPYLLYTVLICLPSLIFMIGLSFVLSSLLKSQAVVFLVLLAYSFLVLVFLGGPLFGLFDSYAFYMPLMYSDFIGLGNIHSVLLIRLSYLFLGLSLIFVSPLLSKRLRQSAFSNIVAGSASIFCLGLALILGFSFTNGHLSDRNYRQELKASSQEFRETQTASVRSYDIKLEHKGKTISATAQLDMVNELQSPLDTILLTLNPGLRVESVTQGSGALNFRQDNHLLIVTPKEPVNSEDSISLTISYAGKIDERYCFLDIDDARFESQYRLWIYDIPKHYALITSDFVHLTPESGWYPIPGLPPGAAYPALASSSYSKYTLTVTTPAALTAISQGKPETQSLDGQIQYTFKPDVLLPKISLTIGSYQQQEIEVDNVIYSLYVKPGHDYFTPLLSEVGEQLPELIKQLRDEYEVMLGLDYPYNRLSLVEVPIHIYSYQRLWTVAHETVQPQLTFLPEMGTICSGPEFRINTQQAQRMRQGANQTQAQIQRGLLNRFIRGNLIAPQANARNMMRRNSLGMRFQADIEPQFELFPNFFTFTTQVFSKQWPVLSYSFEAFLREHVAPPMALFRQTGRGLSREEEINQDLKSRSLEAMIADPALDAAVVQDALQAKGRTLLTQLEAKYQGEDFDEQLIEFLNSRRYSIVSEQVLTDFLSSLGDISLSEIVDSWYTGTQIPGFIVSDVESYDVIDREKTRTQIKFLIGNPSSVGGITKILLRYRTRGRDMAMRGQGQNDYSFALFIPALTSIQLGIVTDEPPAMMTVDTFVSQNIPAAISVNFMGQREVKEETPFEGEISKPYDRSDFFPADEIIVDNEDPGFEIQGTAKQNWLSRTLQNLFKVKDSTAAFTGMNMFNPPVFWTLSTNQDYYGQFVRSAHVKKSGEGEDSVVWNVEIKEAGEYDIYFYNGTSQRMQRGMMEMQMQQRQSAAQTRGSNQQGPNRRFNRSPGQKVFKVYFQNGIEEVVIELEEAGAGWNLIGSFQLDAGPNKIEMTDQSDSGYVLADAVKWVKK